MYNKLESWVDFIFKGVIFNKYFISHCNSTILIFVTCFRRQSNSLPSVNLLLYFLLCNFQKLYESKMDRSKIILDGINHLTTVRPSVGPESNNE